MSGATTRHARDSRSMQGPTPELQHPAGSTQRAHQSPPHGLHAVCTECAAAWESCAKGAGAPHPASTDLPPTFSALPSWKRPMPTLITTTPRMRPQSGHACRPALATAAVNRIQMNSLHREHHSTAGVSAAT